MKVVQAEVYPLLIPYKGDFSISRGKVGGGQAKRTVVIVKLMDEDGRIGWGEGSPSHLWSPETMESVVTTLERYLIPTVIGHSSTDIAGLHRRMDLALGPSYSIAHPIAKSALDMALHDLWGKTHGMSISELWGYQRTKEATLSWTVSCKQRDEAEALIESGLEQGYSHFNIKLGINARFDIELCELIRERMPDSFLWGDANGGYTFQEALHIIPSLESAGLNLLEQPIPSNQMRNWHALKQRLRIPLAVDEPIVSPRDLMEWIRQDLITAYATKVTRTGGLFPSRICAEIAEHTPLMTVCSGLTDTGLGLAANLHLACAFGITTPCAWNGPQFLDDDILQESLDIQGGVIRLPEGSGLGVEIDEGKLDFYRWDG